MTTYRLLNEGEIIQEGDDILGGNGSTWIRVSSTIGGTPRCAIYRRPLSPEPALKRVRDWFNYYRITDGLSLSQVCIESLLRILESPDGGNTASVERVELSETGNSWIPIAERKPTKEDGNNRGQVLARYEDGLVITTRFDNLGDDDTHWCRIPAFPKEDSASPPTPTPRPDSTLTGQARRWEFGYYIDSEWTVYEEPGHRFIGHAYDKFEAESFCQNHNRACQTVIIDNVIDVQLAKSAEGSEVPTPQTATDDGREPKSLENATLISALRKVAGDLHFAGTKSAFRILADELERGLE